jgi:hypothetical protein
MAIRVVVSRWTRFRFVRDVSATHRQSFAAAGFLAIGVMQGALSRGSCSNSEGRQTRWSYPNHPNVCSVQARRALKLRGGHSNNEVTENQAEYWSWVAFYLRSDLGINATAARLPRSALESCARLWIRRDRRRKSYLGSKALRRRARALRVRVVRLDGAHDGRERCHTNRFYWSVLILSRRRSRFDEINGLANR